MRCLPVNEGPYIVDRSYAMSGKAVHGNQECPQPDSGYKIT